MIIDRYYLEFRITDFRSFQVLANKLMFIILSFVTDLLYPRLLLSGELSSGIA